MKIFVTGVDGYIGVLLAPLLASRGHDVAGLDTGFYRRGWWYSSGLSENAPSVTSGDIRRIREGDLQGVDAVVHLAELSNDPLGELRPQVTTAINHSGSVRLAGLAKAAGVSRFIYSSSCSVYGAGSSDWLTERDRLDPQTTYARCKALVETEVGAMADASFSPVFLRNATAYGASPRMRFDLVLNNLAARAAVSDRIAMTSDGTPWRPLVHVLDICRAIVCALEAPRDAVHAEIFNVGRNDQNFQIREIAELVRQAFPSCKVTVGASSGDTRSYRVSFDKIHARLPGFACDWDAARGVSQLQRLFDRVQFSPDQFATLAYTRLAELQYLMNSGQVDVDLFWRCDEVS